MIPIMYKMIRIVGSWMKLEDAQALPRGRCTQGSTMKLNLTNR